MSSNSSPSSLDVVVRPLGPADIEAVSALARAARAGEYSRPIISLDMEMRGKPEQPVAAGRVAFGAFAGGRLVAAGCATPDADGWGYISRIYVHPECRSKGVGRALVERIEAHLKESGCHTAHLAFWGHLANLQRFWAKTGYHRVGTDGGVTHEGLQSYVVTCYRPLVADAPAVRPRAKPPVQACCARA